MTPRRHANASAATSQPSPSGWHVRCQDAPTATTSDRRTTTAGHTRRAADGRSRPDRPARRRLRLGLQAGREAPDGRQHGERRQGRRLRRVLCDPVRAAGRTRHPQPHRRAGRDHAAGAKAPRRGAGQRPAADRIKPAAGTEVERGRGDGDRRTRAGGVLADGRGADRDLGPERRLRTQGGTRVRANSGLRHS